MKEKSEMEIKREMIIDKTVEVLIFHKFIRFVLEVAGFAITTLSATLIYKFFLRDLSLSIFIALALSIVIYAALKTVEKDIKKEVYLVSIHYKLTYSDFSEVEDSVYSEYRLVINAYEIIRLNVLAKAGVEAVRQEVKGNAAYFDPTLKRNVIHNHRDFCRKEEGLNSNIAQDYMYKGLLLMIPLTVMTLMSILLKFQFGGLGLHSLTFLQLALLMTFIILQVVLSFMTERKRVENDLVEKTITEALWGR